MYNQQVDILSDFQKIILIGDAGTGKTNIIYAFTKEKIANYVMPTVAIQFNSKIVTINSNLTIRIQIWDTAGQETYRSLTMNQYRNNDGAFIVFDVSRRDTFEHVSYWLENLREKAAHNISIGLLGHKSDQSRREVSREQGEQFAARQHIFYAETTIKDIPGINSAFIKLIENIHANKKNKQNSSNGNELKLGQGQPETGGCSC